MAKKLNNYKLYVTGTDAERKPVLLTFLIYAVTSVKAAKELVCADKKHRRILHHYKLTPAEVKFRAVKCDENGIASSGRDAATETDILCSFPGRSMVSYTGKNND